MNIFNHESANFLAEAGVSQVTLSPELTLEQLRMLVPALPVPAEVIVHGALPLMVSEYCAAGSLLSGGIPETCPARYDDHAIHLPVQEEAQKPP